MEMLLILAVAVGGADKAFDERAVNDKAVGIETATDKAGMEFRVILPTLTGTITGQVFDAASRLSQPAVVSFTGEDTGDIFVDSSGVFALIGFPVGEYWFRSTSSSRRYISYKHEVVLYSTDTLRLEFPMVAIEPVHFPEGEKIIEPVYNSSLDSIGCILVQHRNLMLEIDGYTDSTTIRHRYPSNLALSRARADEVKNYLVNKFKLGAERFVTAGFGATMPVASNETEEGKRQNRRVEFTFIAGREKQ